MKIISNKAVKSVAASLAFIAGTFTGALSASAATLQEITSFGNNPTNLRMHLYVPDALPNNAPILLAVHYCTGSGPALYSGTQFASLADKYGYIVIYPSATRSGQCFDVSSPQALTRNGGSDPVAIMSMVDYVKQHFNVDSTRVFVTGVSSGAMMTNVLLGLYPDVFKAGAAFAGVPFGCFATTDGSSWNSACSGGNITKTPQAWGDLVRAAYPSYSGPRPRVQLWHGTADTTLNYVNFGEEIKQWTNVQGLTQTPSYTDTPQSGYTRTRYGSSGDQAPVEAISMQGVSHNLPINAAEAIRFFGLNSAVNSSASSSRSATSSSRSSINSSTTTSRSSSSINSNSGDQCNWYGMLYPVCTTTPSGWGWENQRNCIARSTCSAQPAPYGVVSGSNSTSSATSSRASSSSSAIAISSLRSSSSSSISATGKSCNWYGTRYPLCTVTQSGWGWENQQSCISPSTCSGQPAPYGIVN